ncbi:FAD-binding domain-containing protein, partial [Glycomyces dulcitolivorans]|uniref:FAD-binding domain-containing protein n=1 Tax=Glycomyces dulcitolivorans TaxID=2200759 RepID=UPI002FCD8194
ADLPRGGERAGLARLDAWAPDSGDYAERHDDLAGDRTSRLSPYLALGCLSARELAADPRLPEAMVRQLCWRDFHLQVLAAFPDLVDTAYRRGADDVWDADLTALEAWRAGATGIGIVDAGMRQLLAEGWMHNRARLITAGYLVKALGLDWRDGAAHFAAHLVDLDEANNAGNWQWTAGTGNDTRPNRGFNHERQAGRFDPEGAYRRRWARS